MRSFSDVARRTSRAPHDSTETHDFFRLFVDGDLQAVDFDQQHGSRVERKAEVEGRFDCPHDPLVHHFERGGNNSRADDAADCQRRRVDCFKNAQERAIGGRIAGQPHGDARANAKRPLAADEETGEIVAGRLRGRSAELDDRTVRQHDSTPNT